MSMEERKLADNDQDGALTLHEFCVAMKLVLVRRKGHDIPSSLPESLVQLRKHDSRRSVNPRLRFSIPPPPPSSAPNSHTITSPSTSSNFSLQNAQSLKEIPPIEEKSESPTKKLLLNQKSAPNLLESSASSEKKDVFSGSQDTSKKKSKKEEDEKELMSESFSEPVGTDEEDGGAKKERMRNESLGFGYDPSLERFRGKAMTLEPAVARLISFGDGGDTDDGGSADDTAVLVEEKKMRRRSSSLSEQAPKPKPRRKKMSPKVDQSSSSTEDTPTRKAAPPPPAPYHDHTRRSTSLPRSTSVDSFQTQETTPFINKDPTSPSRSDSTGSNYQSKPVRPPRAHEVSYSRQLDEDNDRSGSEDIGRGKKKDDSRQQTLSPDSADDKFVKGHARNPSWGMILKDEENPITDDLPSAEPPKLPPRTSKHNLSANIVEETSPPPGQLSRSASTGSLASIGRGVSISAKARSPPVDSDSILTSMELVTESHLPKRPAPAPPTKPKPRKVPMYPPSFKRVEDSPDDSDLVMSMEERSCLVESYKKKTKLELQRSIKSLKDDNAMFTKLNQDLRRILTGLREEQTRLEVLMDRQR